MPMKKIYNLLYCIDNTKKEDSYSKEFSQVLEDESEVLDLLDKVEFSPSKKAVDNILDFAKKALAL